jgi:hypothetical protein
MKTFFRNQRSPAGLAVARIRHGRPWTLLGRVLAGLALAQIVLHSGAGPAATAGALAGTVTWLALTIRSDLAPPPGR